MRRVLLALCCLLLVRPAFAATIYYPTDTASSVSGYNVLSKSVGSGVQTSTTNTTDGPVSDTQWPTTATAGGSTLKWLSEPVADVALGWTGSTYLQWRDAKESATAANAELVCWVYRWDATTQDIDTTNGTKLYMNAELTTNVADNLITKTIHTGPVLSNGDRIALLCYLDDAGGTMSGTSSKNVTFKYNQTSSAMSLQFPETTTDPTSTAFQWVSDDE